MELYKNQELFNETINKISNDLKINEAIIEKDYFVSMILRELSISIDGLLFKGGTSLSKCHKVIKRFSEDIDLTLDISKFSQSNKRKANKAIIDTCKKLDFKVLNFDYVVNHTHANFNRFIIEYPSIFKSPFLNQNIIIELTFITKAFPSVLKPVSSIIYDYLMQNEYTEFMSEYDLQPFNILVQTLERTLIDKIFAICDYYLLNNITSHSRHLYDIYKLNTIVDLYECKQLIQEVRIERQKNKMCISSKNEFSISDTLKEIIAKDAYKNDYNDITIKLLSENVDYQTVIKELQNIADTDLFDKRD